VTLARRPFNLVALEDKGKVLLKKKFIQRQMRRVSHHGQERHFHKTGRIH
jgi:hypothetical protein